MKKISVILFTIILTATMQAQKTIDGLIAAERAFAQYAADHSTKKAFLQFMDTAGLQFVEGKPIKSSELWAKREESTTRLKWRPQFAEIAASNDFGYTSGPWTIQKTDADSITARGQYSTVWQANENGEWKFLIDYGHDYKEINSAGEVQKIKTSRKLKADKPSLLQAQEAFNLLVAINPQAAYQKYLSKQSVLNFNGYLPITKTFDQLTVFNDTGSANFNIQGSGIAASGDMGFVYGNSTYKDKTDNYLHIWRHEKDGWKIALAVVYL